MSLKLKSSAARWKPLTTNLSPAAFDALLRRITRPGRYCPKVAKVLSTPALWDDTCDKTSTPEDHGDAEPA
jgi:hypothetical protein